MTSWLKSLRTWARTKSMSTIPSRRANRMAYMRHYTPSGSRYVTFLSTSRLSVVCTPSCSLYATLRKPDSVHMTLRLHAIRTLLSTSKRAVRTQSCFFYSTLLPTSRRSVVCNVEQTGYRAHGTTPRRWQDRCVWKTKWLAYDITPLRSGNRMACIRRTPVRHLVPSTRRSCRR